MTTMTERPPGVPGVGGVVGVTAAVGRDEAERVVNFVEDHHSIRLLNDLEGQRPHGDARHA